MLCITSALSRVAPRSEPHYCKNAFYPRTIIKVLPWFHPPRQPRDQALSLFSVQHCKAGSGLSTRLSLPYQLSYRAIGVAIDNIVHPMLWPSIHAVISDSAPKAPELQLRYLACRLPMLKRPQNSREFVDRFLNGR